MQGRYEAVVMQAAPVVSTFPGKVKCFLAWMFTFRLRKIAYLSKVNVMTED